MSRLATLAAAALSLAACQNPARQLGADPVRAASNTDAMLAAMGSRFGPTRPDQRYLATRAAFARSALAPSRIWNDTSMWTSRTATSRTVETAGYPSQSGYVLTIRPSVPTPARAGDYRQVSRLQQLGDGEFEWHRADELGIGPVTGDELGRALGSVLTAAGTSSEPAARQAYRTALPRTAAALGRLYTVDSLRLVPGPDRSTLVTVVVTLHPRRLAATHPNYARYLERYVEPASYRFELVDLQGARWWEAHAARSRLTLRMRVRDGALIPLTGAPRRMPATMRIRGQASAKVGVFTVGARSIEGDVTIARRAAEKAVSVRFRQEPNWSLPLLAEQLLRTPLRRPFQGEGAALEYAVVDRPGSATVLRREYRVAVQESAIMRWFGGLGQRSLSDFRQGAEQEADRFAAEAFSALREDVSIMARSWR